MLPQICMTKEIRVFPSFFYFWCVRVFDSLLVHIFDLKPFWMILFTSNEFFSVVNSIFHDF